MRTAVPRLVTPVFITLAVPMLAAQGPDSAAIRELVERQMRRSRLPAVALAVVGPDQHVYATGFSRNGTTVTADTPFLLGSVTKTFTALAIAQLVDAGRIRFEDAVAAHLPGFALKAPDSGRTITLRHALTHTSGLSQWSGHDRRAQREGRFDHISPVRPPGIEFEYSSLNYIILGALVEAVSGMSYGDYVRVRIFEPLEMRSSFTELSSAQSGGLVQGHRFVYGLTIPGREIQQPAPLVPAGFVISTARDLGNYLGMMLNDGQFRGRQIVSRATLVEMLTPWGGGATGPGMAWGIGSTSIGHAGSTPTFSARLSLLPKERYGIALLTNVNSGPFVPGLASVMDGVIRIVRGGQAEPARPDEIILKAGLLVLVLAGVIRTAVWFRRWSRRGYPLRLIATRKVAMTLSVEAVAAVVVLFGIPRWIGVPLGTMLEYFPDLGFAMIIGVVAGVTGALMRSFIVSSEAAG
jgi:CubicO group peptidase (beta-lactamase class C family)